MPEVIETYGAIVDCPIEGCGFAFRVENCRTEEEGRKMLLYVVRLHSRLRHVGTTALEAKITVVDKKAHMAGNLDRPN